MSTAFEGNENKDLVTTAKAPESDIVTTGTRLWARAEVTLRLPWRPTVLGSPTWQHPQRRGDTGRAGSEASRGGGLRVRAPHGSQCPGGTAPSACLHGHRERQSLTLQRWPLSRGGVPGGRVCSEGSPSGPPATTAQVSWRGLSFRKRLRPHGHLSTSQGENVSVSPDGDRQRHAGTGAGRGRPGAVWAPASGGLWGAQRKGAVPPAVGRHPSPRPHGVCRQRQMRGKAQLRAGVPQAAHTRSFVSATCGMRSSWASVQPAA